MCEQPCCEEGRLTATHCNNWQAGLNHPLCLSLKQPEALPLAVHICRVQVEAAHLILALEQHLPIADSVGVADVTEVLNTL